MTTDPRNTFQAQAVRVLRQHRRCGDAYPEDGWSEVNAALAQYAAEKRHAKQYDAMMRRLRRRRVTLTHSFTHSRHSTAEK